ncbi:MAG: helix-turn-helix domain-containing protein, partial [Acidimicrobiia bacterium]
MDVALVQWPSDEALRSDLAERRHPRLLLVETDVEPPICSDPLEDWVRLPVSRADRNARLRALEARHDGGEPSGPHLDALGTLS